MFSNSDFKKISEFIDTCQPSVGFACNGAVRPAHAIIYSGRECKREIDDRKTYVLKSEKN